jgi:hypothetical protein
VGARVRGRHGKSTKRFVRRENKKRETGKGEEHNSFFSLAVKIKKSTALGTKFLW